MQCSKKAIRHPRSVLQECTSAEESVPILSQCVSTAASTAMLKHSDTQAQRCSSTAMLKHSDAQANCMHISIQQKTGNSILAPVEVATLQCLLGLPQEALEDSGPCRKSIAIAQFFPIQWLGLADWSLGAGFLCSASYDSALVTATPNKVST